MDPRRELGRGRWLPAAILLAVGGSWTGVVMEWVEEYGVALSIVLMVTAVLVSLIMGWLNNREAKRGVRAAMWPWVKAVKRAWEKYIGSMKSMGRYEGSEYGDLERALEENRRELEGSDVAEMEKCLEEGRKYMGPLSQTKEGQDEKKKAMAWAGEWEQKMAKRWEKYLDV